LDSCGSKLVGEGVAESQGHGGIHKDDDSEVGSPTDLEVTHHSEGLDLAVVLPFGNVPASQSGVKLLLDEESLLDVDGYLAARDNP
ncbi:hypothetical protein A2U01_0086157, partial [Trifolium medium]|nr:hypothetical protein [Trifolium medium]